MPPLFTNVAIAVPVIERSESRAASSAMGKEEGKVTIPRRLYGDEPLPLKPSEKAPRNGRIVGRIAETDRVVYTIKIGDVQMEDVGIHEVLDYVSPYDLEKFEHRQFEEEREVLELARIQAEREERLRKERQKSRAKTKGTVQYQEIEGVESLDSVDDGETAVGKHGRARPTYTHMFLQPRERKKRRKRDSKTGELMPRSDSDEDEDEDKQSSLSVKASSQGHAKASVRTKSPPAAFPQRRRRKRDPETGVLLPLEPMPTEGDHRKRPRRRRHPQTGMLMPVGWRYNPAAEKDASFVTRGSMANTASPSMHRLSISYEHASKRLKMGSESSSDGLPVEVLRSPAQDPSHAGPKLTSASPRIAAIEVESSESDEIVRNKAVGQRLLSSFKQRPIPKASSTKSTEPERPRPLDVSPEPPKKRKPMTLKQFLSKSQAESSPDDVRLEHKTGAHPAGTQPKTSIMNPVAPAAHVEEEDSAEEGEEEFFVEAIMGHRLSDPKSHPGKKSTMLYRVKWEGYNEPTWEPLQSFGDQSIVWAYRKHVGLDSGPKQKSTPEGDKAPAKVEVSRKTSTDEKDPTRIESDDGYVVEAILSHRLSDSRTHPGKPQTMLYQVKWAGYDAPTWEPATSFDDPDLVEEYRKKVGLSTRKAQYQA